MKQAVLLKEIFSLRSATLFLFLHNVSNFSFFLLQDTKRIFLVSKPC